MAYYLEWNKVDVIIKRYLNEKKELLYLVESAEKMPPNSSGLKFYTLIIQSQFQDFYWKS